MSATIAKRSGFDPNQPRDEDGKWTDGASSGASTSEGYDDLLRLAGGTDQDIERRVFSGVYANDLSWFPEEMKNDYGIDVTEADARAFAERLREDVREPYKRRGIEQVHVWRGGHDPDVNYEGPVSVVDAYRINFDGVSPSEATDWGDAIEYGGGEATLYRVPVDALEMSAHVNVPGEMLVDPERLELVRTVSKRSGFDPNQPRDEQGKWTDTGASSSGADGLTPEERAAQPNYLKGTSWVPVPITVESLAEVFTPEVLEELGVGGDEVIQRNSLEVDLHRARATDGAMFIDRERKIVAVIDGDALDLEKHQSMVDWYVGGWEGIEAVRASGGSIDLGLVAADAVARSKAQWFFPTTGDGVLLDPDYDGNSTPNEAAQERVARMLATAQTLQDLSNIGPVVLRIATPMSGEFERLDSSKPLRQDEPGRWHGLARQPWSPVLGQWSHGQVPTIVMNTLGRGPVDLDSNWVVNPYYRSGIEQDTQSSYLGTLIHEWGHQVQWAREREEGQAHKDRHTEAWTQARDSITTEYARTNRAEFYAEAFTAWAVDRIPELRRDGRYSAFANFADEQLGFSDFAGSKIDDVEFVMMDGVRVPIAKAKELVAIGCSFDPNVGSIYEYSDGTTEVVNELDDVGKSSGFDPNQPRDEQGRWTDSGASSASPRGYLLTTDEMDSLRESGPSSKSMSGEEFAQWAESIGIPAEEVDLARANSDLWLEARSNMTDVLLDRVGSGAMSPSDVFGEDLWEKGIRTVLGRANIDADDVAGLLEDGEVIEPSRHLPLEQLEEALDALGDLRTIGFSGGVLGIRDAAIREAMYLYADTDEFRMSVEAYVLDSLTDGDRDKAYHRSLDRVAAKQMAQRAVAERMTDVPVEDMVAAMSIANQGVISNDRDRNWVKVDQVLERNTEGYTAQVSINHDTGNYRVEVSTMRFSPVEEGARVVTGSLDDPEVREAIAEVARLQFARQFIGEWANTSNKTVAAATVQRAAAEEFGISDVAASPSGPDDFTHPALDRAARAFVRAQYEATQEMLAAQFPDTTHFTMFRGGDSSARYTDPIATHNATDWREATLVNRPLASFSTSAAESNQFVGRQNSFAAAVPRERIFSTPFTGNGALIEAEFVVLGGPIHGMTRRGQVFYEVDAIGPDVPDLPIRDNEFIMIDGQPVPIGKSSGFDPNQPRDEQGRWTDSGASFKGTEGFQTDDVALEWAGAEDWSLRANQRLKRAVVQDLTDALSDVSNEQVLSLLMDIDPPEFDTFPTADYVSELFINLGIMESWEWGLKHPDIPYFESPASVLEQRLDALSSDDPEVVEQTILGLGVSLDAADGSGMVTYESPDGHPPDVLLWRDYDEGRITNAEFAITPVDRARMIAFKQALDEAEKYAVVPHSHPMQFLSSRDVERGLYADQFREYIADRAVSTWAQTSNKNVLSQALQAAVRDEFGLETERYTAGLADIAEAGQRTYEANKDVLRPLVQRQYEQTQQFLRDVHGEDVTHVRLYRGRNWEGALQEDTEGRLIPAPIVNTNPLSSWSSDRQTALQFASRGAMRGEEAGRHAAVESLVPVERIFSTPATGVGALSEREHTVLGGRLPVDAVMDVVWTTVGTGGGPFSNRRERDVFVTLPDGQVIPLDEYSPTTLAKHLAGKHDQKTHGRWAGGVPHMAGDHSTIDRLRESGAIRTVGVVERNLEAGDIRTHDDPGRQDYRVDYPERLITSLSNRSEEYGNLSDEERSALHWLATRDGRSGDDLPPHHSFIGTLWEEDLLGSYRDPAWSDEHAEVFLNAVSTMETFDVGATFLDAYRLAKDDGMSDAHARSLGYAQVMRTGRFLGIENGSKVVQVYEEVGESGWAHGDYQMQRYRPTSERLAELPNLIENGQVAVAVHAGALDSIIADGRLKNQYESGESSGMYAPQKRRTYETAYLGVDVDAPAKDRPIYGYLFDPSRQGADSGSVGNHWVDQYGDVRLVLKPEVRDRTTVTGGDSLDRKGLAVPLTGELTERDFMLSNLYARNLYDEAQIHRGVTVADIAYVYIPACCPTNRDTENDWVLRVLEDTEVTHAGRTEVKRVRTLRRDIEEKFRAAGIAVPVTTSEFVTLADGTVIPVGDE